MTKTRVWGVLLASIVVLAACEKSDIEKATEFITIDESNQSSNQSSDPGTFGVTGRKKMRADVANLCLASNPGQTSACGCAANKFDFEASLSERVAILQGTGHPNYKDASKILQSSMRVCGV